MWTDLRNQTELINKRLINITKKSQSKELLQKDLISKIQWYKK